VTPRASIGMPVFNRASTVGRAIESVLAQTFTDFELLVSDNASSDGTEPICRRHAAGDPRIRYTRHPATISGLDNFRFVLEQARALAARTQGETDPERRIDRLYRLLYGRVPAPGETELGRRFVEGGSWELYAQALVEANEFSYVD